jgi:hypothetical protein
MIDELTTSVTTFRRSVEGGDASSLVLFTANASARYPFG